MLTFKCFSNEEPCNPVEERKFIISMSKLLELFSTCKRCHRRATASVQQTVGTMVRVGAECEFCGFSWQWSSQPSLRNITAGNLAYSAGILFSGALSAKGFVFYSVWVWQLYQGELSIPTKLLSCSLPLLGYETDTGRCMSGRQWTEGIHLLLVEMDERIHLILKKE